MDQKARGIPCLLFLHHEDVSETSNGHDSQAYYRIHWLQSHPQYLGQDPAPITLLLEANVMRPFIGSFHGGHLHFRGAKWSAYDISVYSRAMLPQQTSRITARANISTSHRIQRAAQKSAPATYWRGGTSRGVIFHSKDLPASRDEQKKIFCSVLGTPDPHGRQLDGFGAGISSLSKVCVLGPPSNPTEWDVDYTFIAVGIEKAECDWGANCGNLTAAVGPWAVERGLLGDVQDGDVQVRILNTNTNKVVRSTFEVRGGEYVVDGNFELEGVGGTGAPIQLDFMNPAGAKTGKLLPTGKVKDVIEFPSGYFAAQKISISCVDAVNPVVFVRASEIGITGTELPDQLHRDMDFRAKVEKLRQRAAVMMGMAEREEDTPRTVPKVAILSSPETHKIMSGQEINQGEVDLVVRAMSDGMPHRALPLSLAMCTAVAANLENSVLQGLAREKRVDPKGMTIGHPSGKVVVTCDFDAQGYAKEASVIRTARKLMEGTVFWKA